MAIQRTAVADYLAQQIQSQEVYPDLLDELQKLVASPLITETEFPATFLKAFGSSGIETKLKNHVFHLMRSKCVEKWIQEQTAGKMREPLSYLAKVQAQWEKRVLRSVNSMCVELGQTLAKPRCQVEQQEMLNHWSDLSNLDIDLSLFRPVYSPKDFLEVLSQLHSPNQTTGGHRTPVTGSSQQIRPFGLIQVPVKTASLENLKERFRELSRSEPHLGSPNVTLSGTEAGGLVSMEQLEQERYHLGVKVLDMDHAPLSQEFLKRGCPHSLRGSMWAQVLGCEISEKDELKYEVLKEAVISNDVMLDKLIMKDVQLTAANDDNYFIFEDLVFQAMLCFSRDTEIAELFSCGSSNPAKAVLRGKSPSDDNFVIYPPNGIIPFHGLAMYCAPFTYVYTDPIQLYFTFRAMYLRFWFRLHQVSSHPQSILALCSLFEDLMQRYEPQLWNHLLSCDVQPTKVVFRWLMRGFSGYFPPSQLLYIWDLIIAYDSLELIPLLAASILSFRKDNLMRVSNLAGVEAILSDLSSLSPITLLQLSLSRT